ncbi:MAG: succinyl-CoA synthetase subunit alpha [Rhodospirillales bacterium]|nr:succinyl-CoA synthetase subunit alpha [Rhodospirillales bacterium]
MTIVRGHHRVLIQGITGKQGTFWTELMQAYGTKVTGGVNPKKAGTEHLGVPVYASAVDAAKDQEADGGIDASVLFIPPLGVKAAALDAIDAGINTLCILTEHIPVQDVMYVMAAAKDAGTLITGPNTAGSVTVGECFTGFMPAFNERIFKKGSIGVMSRSGSLGTLMCQNIVSAGFGQSAFVGIGGDPIIGTTTKVALQALDNFEGTEAVVIVGEIGGSMEEEAAEYAAGMDKPVLAFIAGGAAPPGKKMGHAGAIVIGDKGTYASKKSALEEAGATVLDTPSHVGDVLKERLSA